jgi:DNA-binding CsgD family transcriptional regulator
MSEKARVPDRMPHAAPDRGIVLLDASLAVVALDEGAAALLASLEGLDGVVDDTPNLPEDLHSTLGRCPPADLASLKLHFRLASGDFCCRVYVLESKQLALPQPLVAVHLERDGSTDDLLTKASLNYHLTDREQEALRGIAVGLTSKELAERMSISPNTVKAFVRMIMAKMGVSTRSGIVARLLEHEQEW